jgi:RND family efflux transporter MFP subunit
MSKRRIVWISALMAAVVLVVVVWKLARPGADRESEETSADMAVHVARIARATLRQYVTVYGTVQPEPAGPGRPPAAADVASPVAGILSRVDCVEGQAVARGDLLFRLDSRVADIVFQKAETALAFAQMNFDRQKTLLAGEGTSRKNYLEAEQQLNAARSDRTAAKNDIALLRVAAPLAGIVIQILGRPGEAVELNTVLARIVDLGRLVVAAGVPSREANQLRIGQGAKFEDGTAGVVGFVGAQIDDRTDTVPVRISISAAAGYRPGQFVGVHIVCGVHAACLTVPDSAVVSEFVTGDSGLLVLVEGDRAVRRRVRIGLRESGRTEVTGEDLKEGMTIVSEDAYAVPDGMKIHIVK